MTKNPFLFFFITTGTLIFTYCVGFLILLVWFCCASLNGISETERELFAFGMVGIGIFCALLSIFLGKKVPQMVLKIAQKVK